MYTESTGWFVINSNLPGDGRGRDDPPAGLLVCVYPGLLDPGVLCSFERGDDIPDFTELGEALKCPWESMSGKEERRV